MYSIPVKIRNILYDLNILKCKYFDKAISIGNITVGGTGKTPHTEYLASLLQSTYKTAVLSRGYKRKSKGFLYVSENHSYIDVGDEPLQIAQKFKKITVAVCANRVYAINKLQTEKKINLTILDDAFQHRKVKPKFSILLTTYSNPFFKDHLLPFGRLRDNKEEYTRAKIIIITKCPKNIKPIEKTIWKDNIKLKPFQELFFSTEKYLPLKKVFTMEKSSFEPKDLKDFSLLLITGIANSDGFLKYIKENISQKVTHLNFGDHHNFTKKDIIQITNVFNEINDLKKIIITTEKDAMRLKSYDFQEEFKEKMYFQPIEIEFLFDAKPEFDNKIIELISQN